VNLGLVQKALAVLLTDPEKRREWVEEPDSFAQRLGLGEQERAYLEEVSAPQLREFANGLVNKRLHACLKLLPESARTLDRQFTSLFRQFAKGFRPTGIWKHGHDAIAFSRWLQDKDISPDAAELARFEGVRLSVAQGGLKMFKARTPLEPLGLSAGDVILCWRWKQGLKACRLWPRRELPQQEAPDQIASEGIS
jgi:hypothetical protein